MFVAIFAGTSTRAADLAVTTSSPGILYEFGPFQRHGVTILENGLFEVRVDGCWNSTMRVANANSAPATVSITLNFYTPRGDPYTSVAIARHVVVNEVSTVTITESGCNAHLSRAFGGLLRYTTRRVFSVR
ncbi:hypothetical protein [Acuticoccus kandeliae]|uniref:hypothetical protein n=1 Tax=Acuticoccus kandeliae TaxID=2073160 RepID=UPI0013003B23|nr:hypothetical protein [Acuticoccus kandeliae]